MGVLHNNLAGGRVEIEEDGKVAFTHSLEESGNYDEGASQLVGPKPEKRWSD